MATPTAPYRALEDLAPSLRGLEETIDADATMSICPRFADGTSPGRPEIAPPVAAGPAFTRNDLAYGEELGRGGMGVVRAATQASLGRTVAVKTLRTDAPREGAAGDLLREAWITGALEHPNVVPVHDLAVDLEGQPLLVLKRIEGTAWSRLIQAPDRLRAEFGVEAPLTWHLRTFMQVCSAVAFAHSRGILHRDLKPENVMVGHYGEVYVLDWGLAVALDNTKDDRLPRARDVRHLAGTPAYMAPEMLARPGDTLTPATDVYLLGATLYHLLAGRAPHSGGSALSVMMRVLDSCPDPVEGAPPELEALCRRAMSPDPRDRFPSALALRDAIGEWLEHRPSIALAAEAHARLAALAGLGPSAVDEATRLERYRLMGECRFGFRQALSIWSGNTSATAGLREALEAMVEFELGQRDARAAAALLSELEAPAPELEARLATLRAELDAEAREAAQNRELARQHDVQSGARSRRLFAGVLGIFWCVIPFAWASRGTDSLGWSQVVGGPLIFLSITAVLAYFVKASITRTIVNRRILATIVLTLGSLVVLDTAHWLGGHTPLDALRTHPLIDMGFIVMLVVGVDRRLWPAAVVSVLMAAAAAYEPAWVLWCIGLTNTALSINGWRVWTGDRRPASVTA
jgi:serine/threonine-protein kinase